MLQVWCLIGILLMQRVSETFSLEVKDLVAHVRERAENLFGNACFRTFYKYDQNKACKNVKGNLTLTLILTLTLTLTLNLNLTLTLTCCLLAVSIFMACLFIGGTATMKKQLKSLVLACPGTDSEACARDHDGNWVFCENTICVFRCITKLLLMTSYTDENQVIHIKDFLY